VAFDATALRWLGLSLAWVSLHLLLYVLVLRHVRAFAQERVIFLYHLASTLGLVLALAAWIAVAPLPAWLAGLVGAFALHGIYSISFLELWSLAEGCYSLAILTRIEALRARGAAVDLVALHEIGGSKKSSRLRGLQGLGLVRGRAQRSELTAFGRVVAVVLALLAWSANLKQVG
jgi:hypothetical protein